MTITNSNRFKINVVAESGGTFIPPYPVPTSLGEVVKIAGDLNPDATTVTHQGNDAAPSTYPTNVFADVRPTEVGGAQVSNLMIGAGSESRAKFIESFSAAGAMVLVGTGGHGGTNNFCASMFDFTDARWKRVWTTDGNPGVDNVTNEGPPPSQGGPPYSDVRTGTKVHGCHNFENDQTEYYINGNHWDAVCWNSDHWPTSAPASQLVDAPLAADPRDQFWEISRTEPYPYSAVRVPTSTSSPIISGPHGWLYPGEWNGLQGTRFTRTGYITDCNRYTPTLAGTLAPTQSELPAPAHNWDHYYELKPSEGGGPRGSVIVGRFANMGRNGVTTLMWSHRFDLHTGIWHQFSVNSASVDGINPTPANGGPDSQSSSMASAEDPVTRRAYLIAKSLGSTAYVNYMNLSDRTWRSFNKGTGGSSPSGNTEYLVVDPDRRLLIMVAASSPHLFALDLQTLGPEPIPTAALGGWKIIPYDDIPGVQSVAPWVDSVTAGSAYTHGGFPRMPWRYYPPNGKFYRVNTRSMANSSSAPLPYGLIPVLQRLTPPPIVATPRANFYYTTEASSGRWTLDEITMNMGGNSFQLPTCDRSTTYQVGAFSWFHYVPAIQRLAYAPMDYLPGRPTTRRCVYLIKPY